MKYFVVVILIILWLIALRAMRKAELDFWRFVTGAAGVFIIAITLLQPVLTEPLARIVALVATLPGKLSGAYSAFYKYGTIFIDSGIGAISLKIDFECSGIIEILAYLSLLAFFKVYTPFERVLVGALGTIIIILSNAFRIIVICFCIYFGGIDMYYVAHTFIGRLVFYGLSVALYFYVFTKPQIIKQKVGSFSYDNN